MIVLASKSTTRISLMQNAGLKFDVEVARIDERKIEEENSQIGYTQFELTAKLAEAKALSVSENHPQAFVVGADQTLHINDSYLHKPADIGTLKAQLDLLRGKTHMLCSAVCVAHNNKIVWQHQGLAQMTMHDFTDQERDLVMELEGNQLLQSVGGYRLEGPSIRLFAQIQGDYFTVLGLPLLPLLSALRELKAI